MKPNIQILIDEINTYAKNNQLFWVCAIAKDCLPILKDHVDELHPVAKKIVEHYLDK